MPERIAISKEVGEKYLKEALPDYRVKPVPGDGYCLIHAFKESLASVGRPTAFVQITSSLRNELKKTQYRNASVEGVDILDEFDKWIANPLIKYNTTDTVDLFLEAMSMAFGVNSVVFKSNIRDCRRIDLLNRDNSFTDTLYFLRTEAIHIDPIVPLSFLLKEEELGGESDSDEHQHQQQLQQQQQQQQQQQTNKNN